MENDNLVIGGKTLKSRLFIGTGKFPSLKIMKEVVEVSDSQVVTVALRRVNVSEVTENILDYVDSEKVILMPNTSGAQNAEDAVKLARLSRNAGLSDWVKLEITPEPRYLLPDPIETLKASEILVKEKFHVFPYINADPILAKRLEETGTAAVMPLGAPIGSNQGIITKESIEIIIEQSNIPVIVDAGIGAPSHASLAMELGADAVLVNTALATANNPSQIAYAFKLAVQAGRLGFLSGLPEKKYVASASSPLTGFLNK